VSRRAVRRRGRGAGRHAGSEERLDGRGAGGPRLEVGLLALLPLALVYDLVQASGTGGARNAAEWLVSLPLAPLGERVHALRAALWAMLGLWLVLRRRRAEESLGGPVMRVFLEGFLAALALGPALLAAHRLLAAPLPAIDVPDRPPEAMPRLEDAALLFGAGAYEELVFRLGAYSLAYLGVRRLVSLLGGPLGLARGAADTVGALGSAALFAAFHLEAFTGWLGEGGEPFDGALFAWRFLAGLLLGLLFRWRGIGVAAWAHALFNLGLALGAGPGVFLFAGVLAGGP
jgi:hypothetical protein